MEVAAGGGQDIPALRGKGRSRGSRRFVGISFGQGRLGQGRMIWGRGLRCRIFL